MVVPVIIPRLSANCGLELLFAGEHLQQKTAPSRKEIGEWEKGKGEQSVKSEERKTVKGEK
jgi:hypothetical protein